MAAHCINNFLCLGGGFLGHSGESIHNGHYTAMVRNTTDCCWYFCNDNSVKKCRGITPGAVSLVKLVDGADPCPLFYQRRVLIEQAAASGDTSVQHDVSKPDSPETQAMTKCMNITPKRQQSFQPSACKSCGQNGCVGECMQRF